MMNDISMTAGQFVVWTMSLLAPFGVMCVWCAVLFRRAFWAEKKCGMLKEELLRKRLERGV